MKLEVNIGNRQLMFLVVFVAALFAVGMAGAYNNPPVGGTPSVAGHSVDEIDWSQTIQGGIRATGDICTDQTGGKCLGGSGFGAWSVRSKDTVYQAATDGFVVASTAVMGDNAYLIVYSDSNNPPTTERGYHFQYFSGSGRHLEPSMVIPVRKGDYWKVTCSVAMRFLYWLPVGT